MNGAGGAPLPLAICRRPLSIVMTKAGSRSLFEALVDSSFTENQWLQIAINLCRAVEEMQNKGMVHNDLKNDNVTLDDDLKVHLIDFGLATLENETCGYGEGSAKDWIAPEIMGCGASTFASDIYSVGQILQEIYYEMPVTSDKFESIIQGTRYEDPDDRLNIQEVLQMMEML